MEHLAKYAIQQETISVKVLLLNCTFDIYTHERRQRGAGGTVVPPWIFIHGTDIED